MSLCLFVGGCLWGWVCGCLFSVERVCLYVGLCFCVYSSIQPAQAVSVLGFSGRRWSASSSRPSSWPSRGVDAKLFERLPSTFVFGSCAKMRVDL